MPRLPTLDNLDEWVKPLDPKSVMPRNDPCWCGSGIKWKYCHRDRENQVPLNPFEAEESFKELKERGYCGYPRTQSESCSAGAIDAHTIQRRGGLAAISESGHVLSVLPKMADMIKHNSLPGPMKIGIGKASIFPGFCNAHDTELFRPIEGPNITLGADSALRLSYRAIAMERFRKLVIIDFMQILRQADRGRPFEVQAKVQEGLHYFLAGQNLGLRDSKFWKSQYDARIAAKDVGGMFFWFARFDRILPIAGCGAFFPEYDFLGNSLQDLGQAHKMLDHVALNITSFGSQTVACLGWIGNADGASRGLAKSLQMLPQDRKASAIGRLAVEHIENIYFRPSWWERLSPKEQNELKQRMRHGGLTYGRLKSALVEKNETYFDASVVQEVANFV